MLSAHAHNLAKYEVKVVNSICMLHAAAAVISVYHYPAHFARDKAIGRVVVSTKIAISQDLGT
jgi:hypothetical protein